MKKLLLFFALLPLAGCGGESALPNPTGKGTVRAINAMPQTPTVAFRIEERLLDNLSYGDGSPGQRWDDFEYAFNFEVDIIGEMDPRRVATEVLKVDADRDYTLVLTGDPFAPTVTVWEQDEREFDGTETVFQVQFAHTAAGEAALDVYFADAATPPALGEERATLNFGEVSAAIDLPAGDFVLTITAAGDPTTVLYQSADTTYAASQAIIVPLLTADENSTAPFIARVISSLGSSSSLPDPRFPPTIRFIHAAMSLATSDVYDDAMLTNLVLADHAFTDVESDMDVGTSQISYTYTAAGNPGAILFETGFLAFPGFHHNFIVVDTLTGLQSLSANVDRRTVATFAKVRFFPAANNHDVLDLFIVDAGVPLDDDTPLFVKLIYTLQSPNLSLDTGSYDIYLTADDDRNTIVAGPVQLDIALGEFQEIFVFDTVDPATAEIRLIPTQ